MKKFKLNFNVFGFIILIISTISIFADQNFNTLSDEQLFFFLQQWPECKVNEDTKDACDNERLKVRYGSPRIKHSFFEVINSYKNVAIKAGNNPDEAQQKTENDISHFLNTEFSVDIPEEIDQDKYPELVKFIKKYGLPRIHNKEIEKFKEDISKRSYGMVKGLPQFFLKGNDIDRAINAVRMKRCIEINNLDQLDVARKYIGKVDGDDWKIFAEKINLQEGKVISLTQIQQLAKLAEETGFRDWNNNWLYDENNKKVCIDTEDSSFIWAKYVGYKGIDLPRHCKANYVISLWALSGYMEIEAQKWLSARIKELVESSEGVAEDKPLCVNKKYDDPEINFKKVRREFEELRYQATSQEG